MSKLKKSEQALNHIRKAKDCFSKGKQGLGVFHARHALKLAGKEMPVEETIIQTSKLAPSEDLDKARIDEGLSEKDKQYARWKRAGDQIEGVHTAAFRSAPGTSNAGYALDIGDKEMARNNHHMVRDQQKRMAQPSLDKAKVDDMIRGKTKEQVRSERKQAPKGQTGTLESYHPIGRNTGLGQLARRYNLEERKQMPKPSLPKSDMYEDEESLEKARSDASLNLEQKVRARQARNDRSVKQTRTPSGQPTRTFRSDRRRANELEIGPAHYSNPDSQGRPMTVRGIPAERRQGEKIVGTPRTMQSGNRDPRHTSAEATYGVHMHSGSMAGKQLPVGGGPRSAAPVSADREGKRYVTGGATDPRQRHSAVRYGQENINPRLTRSEKPLDKRCWDGYEPTPGKEAYSKGSCRPIKKADAFKQSIPKNMAAPKPQAKPMTPPKQQSIKPQMPKAPKPPKGF